MPNRQQEQPVPKDSSQDKGAVSAPTITLPKGGGAIRGIGEKFAANPVTGTGFMSVPIATSLGRSGFGPQLSLSYDSGAGNGPFGLGWNLSLPSITRKTDKGLPKYQDAEESDIFILSGAEDLVPVLVNQGGNWVPEPVPDRTVGTLTYKIKRYRPRIEGLFARIERWTNANGVSHWRSISKDNITTLYGYGSTDESRIVDPANETRIFSWLICESYDDKGNAIRYEYKEENSQGIDDSNVHEANRQDTHRTANRYIKRIKYCNKSPRIANEDLTLRQDWLFEVVFDYDEHGKDDPKPNDAGKWLCRHDPFSSYRAGFEVRTYRLCQRVLMFHHFPLEDIGTDGLVKSTDFVYRSSRNNSDDKQKGNPIASFIASVTHTGYKRKSTGGYADKSTPPLQFEYSEAKIQEQIREVDADSLENLPQGLDNSRYQWVDLDGEGLSGMLTEQGSAWFYKRNQSAVPVRDHAGKETTVARFAPLECVATMPSPANLSGGQQLLDLAGDGQLDVVEFDGPLPGFFERTPDEEWETHRPFTSLPNISWRDPNLKFIDLTGDGHADVLITEDEAFSWYPSLAEAGFGRGEKVRQAVDEERGPRLVFADGTQSIYLADMSGDGLTDLVRIRNGEVCYWPNLGYGRFGSKITMDDAPWFDAPDMFDQRRIRLADIDGSGVVDILYLTGNGVHLYFNQSGNGWSERRILTTFPRIDNLSAVSTVDLLGNGTACLVWSSPLPGDARSTIRYIDLMGGQKPHLLVKTINNLGAETEVTYAPSTKFYLQDKQAGKPWITKLPFPVHCVEKVTMTDNWRKTKFSSTYSYHHGYFDGIEREFRGFGRVEQKDVESYGKFYQGNVASPYITDNHDLYQPPIKTITWYHTGAAIDRERILTQFANEYFAARYSSAFLEKTLPEPELPADLSADEWREALRACKGMVLRQESYELDVDALQADEPKDVPVRIYSAATHNCHIQRIQPRGENKHAVFLVTESEALSYHYELALPKEPAQLSPDPRIAHTLNLRHDEYGNPQQSLTIAYGRVALDQNAHLPQAALIDQVQTETHIAYTETRYTNDVILPEQVVGQTSPIKHYRLRLPYEIRTYEITGIPKPTSRYFNINDLRKYALCEDALYPPSVPGNQQINLTPLLYHQQPQTSGPHRRMVEHVCTRYFNDGDDSTGAPKTPTDPLPLGQHGPRGLKYEDYKLALTNNLLGAVFDAKLTADVLAKLNTATISGYTPGTAISSSFIDQWWMRSGIAGFASDAAAHFYLPEEYTDPFGNVTTIAYDSKYDLFIQSSKDAVGNTSGVVVVQTNPADPSTKKPRFDYRVLAPIEMVDANGNYTEVYFDILGMVIASAVKGKGDEADNLSSYTDTFANPDLTEVLRYFDLPSLTPNEARDRFSPIIGNATSRFLYHFGEKTEDGKVVWGGRPAGACAIVREQHVASLAVDDPPSPLQIAFECSDGMGTVLMKRSQAEPITDGGILRWIVSGKTVFNNKGKPVKQYEPYFSASASCCAEGDVHEEVGVTPIIYYDAAGRVMRTEMPDGTFSRVEFSPWHVKTYDANDTVLESRWYRERLTAVERGVPLHQPNDSPQMKVEAVAAEALAQNAEPQDKRAARLAAVHANTPAQVHLDSLGREVIAIAHNRLEDANGTYTVGSKHYRNEYYLTFTKLDAEGKPLWIRDARGNLVMQYITPAKANNDPSDDMPTNSVPCYDIAGNLLFQHSMDAGDRWMLMDAAGKPMLAWDSRDNVLMSSYDALHRPTTLELKNPIHPAWIVVGLTQYGEETTGDQANNRRGKPYRSFDQSGMVTNQEFDFKGNARRINRRLANDYEVDTDWRAVLQLPLHQEPVSLLMAETFNQITEYDALNRMTRQYNWHRAGKPVAVYEPGYNARGLLVSEYLTVGASKTATGHSGGTKTSAIRNISYDAKGQRLSIIYDNNITTKYTYDPNTFRLLTLVSTRSNKTILQNLSYIYDPSGNITEIFDAAVPTEFFNNAVIEPRKRYVYDALYRLIEATGREHAGQLNHDARNNWNDCSYRVDYGADNSKAWRNYIQRYTYDSVGNILVMEHTALGSSTNNWTRKYQYATDNNRLLATGMGAVTVNHYVTSPTLDYRYSYNVHGSMTSLPHLPTMDWDYTEHLSHISRAPASQGTDPDGCSDSSLEAWYRYDAAKQRTCKRVKKQGGLVEERFYLGGLEWYRRTLNGMLKEEIETLHLFDGQHRLLMVDQVIESPRGKSVLYRYTLSNHLGSSAVEVDENADIISYEEYHPYGTSAYQSGHNAAEVKLKRYRYTGMERDEESGLSYHSARYYLPWLGIWGSCDPKGIADGPNRYAYVSSNPIIYSDPTGTQLIEQMELIEFQRIPTIALRGKDFAYYDPIRRYVSSEAHSWGLNPADYVCGHSRGTPQFSTPAGGSQLISPQTATSNAAQSVLERAEAQAIRARNAALRAQGMEGPLEFVRDARVDMSATPRMQHDAPLPEYVRSQAANFDPAAPQPLPTKASGRSVTFNVQVPDPVPGEAVQLELNLGGPTRSVKPTLAVPQANMSFDFESGLSPARPPIPAPVQAELSPKSGGGFSARGTLGAVGGGVKFGMDVAGMAVPILVGSPDTWGYDTVEAEETYLSAVLLQSIFCIGRECPEVIKPPHMGGDLEKWQKMLANRAQEKFEAHRQEYEAQFQMCLP